MRFDHGSPLPGGAVNDAVRIDDTVRRRLSPRADFVHDLLRLLEDHAWPGAPRFLGIDGQGREVLGFVEGHAAWEPDQPGDVTCDESLAAVVGLLRELHDLTAGSALAGGGQVVCHNDLAPRNTVYRDLGGGLRPVAFIDWDLAAPGERLHDLAHVCWQYLDLGPAIDDVGEAARRARVICESYGLDDRSRLVDTILWWQDRCWRGIESGAAAGDPAMVRLCEIGANGEVRAAHRWTQTHRDDLDALIR